MCMNKKSQKMPKGKLDVVNRKLRDNKKDQKKKEKRQTMSYKTLHRKLKTTRIPLRHGGELSRLAYANTTKT